MTRFSAVRRMGGAGVIACTLVLSILAGCANYQPGDPIDEPNGMAKGPGLFSGKDGVFTIYGDSADDKEPAKK